jgi:branched-chain amino acid transport system ATP-binding protein
MAALLAIENLHAGYGPIEVLKGVSLEVRPGEIVALIGANGAGKTSTLMSISGCVRPRAGRVLLEGKDLAELAPHEVMRRGICHAPEGRKIFPRLTVLENLQMGAFARSDKAGIDRDVAHAFELFPILAERRNQPGGTLSGGEQQMLAVARALMGSPRLLLLDEPSLGLAPLIVVKIFEVVRKLNQEGIAVLLVEQAARMALRLAHRGYVMEMGQITISGSCAELMNDRRVQDAYLGG